MALRRRHVLAGLGAAVTGAWARGSPFGSGTVRMVGPGQTYPTIAAAHTAAGARDQIVCVAGTPRESTTISKDVDLDFSACVWDFTGFPSGSLIGGGLGAIEIFAANCTVRAGEVTGVGMDLTAGDLTSAIRVTSGSGNVTVIGGYFHGNQNGVGANPTNVAPLHYGSGGSYNTIPAGLGFNLADITYQNISAIAAMPGNWKALLWIGSTADADAAFKANIDALAPYAGKIWGFYMFDTADPSGTWGTYYNPVFINNQIAYIKSKFPNAKTYAWLANLGTDDYHVNYATYGTFPGYTPANVNLDYFGIGGYPCAGDLVGSYDLSVIANHVNGALAAGIPAGQVCGTYQTFGGVGWGRPYAMPSAQQLTDIINTWAPLLPKPPFEHFYAWGQQLGDTSLSMVPALQSVAASHNAGLAVTLNGTRLFGNGLTVNTGQLTHNAYIGEIASLTLINVDSRSPVEAHAMKSRAAQLHATGGFYQSDHGACFDIPEGGQFTLDSLTMQKLLATADDEKFINYASENTNQLFWDANTITNCRLDLQMAIPCTIHTLGGTITFVAPNTKTGLSPTAFGGGLVVNIP